MIGKDGGDGAHAFSSSSKTDDPTSAYGKPAPRADHLVPSGPCLLMTAWQFGRLSRHVVIAGSRVSSKDPMMSPFHATPSCAWLKHVPNLSGGGEGGEGGGGDGEGEGGGGGDGDVEGGGLKGGGWHPSRCMVL